MIKKILCHPQKAIRRVWSIIWLWITCKVNKVSYAGFPYIDGRILISKEPNGQIILGKNVSLNSGRRCNPVGFENKMEWSVTDGACIRIGDGAGLSNAVIYATKNISIGNHVLIGNGVKIYDTDFHSLDVTKRSDMKTDDDIRSKEVIIGDGAFIGAGSVILKGVTIGKNSIVGACSLVSKDIPDGEIWGGNPARFIRKIQP